MSVLREGTKVKTTDGLTGNVEARYDLGTVVYYIVKMENGALHKYFADQLTEIEEEPEKAPEEEPTGSDSITITREEYRKLTREVIQEIIHIDIESGDLMSAFGMSTRGAVLYAKLELALFGESKENE